MTRLSILLLMFVMAAAAMRAHADHAITVTVHEGARQTFAGLGCNHCDIWPKLAFRELPEDVQWETMRLLWQECNFQYYRVWLERTESTDNFLTMVSQTLDILRGINPDARLLLIPHGRVGEPAAYAGHFARKILELRIDHGIWFYATGISNEPNNPAIGMSMEMIPAIVKALRDSLDYLEEITTDYLGLDTIRIIAPEASNTGDPYFNEYIDALIADPEAMASLHGFGVHSYNMCMTKDALDKFAPYLEGDGAGTHALWQTESSNTLQPEDPATSTQGDSAKGAETAARLISDLNLGVTHWLFWKGINGFTENDNGSVIIGHNQYTGEYRVFLKYYYLRQLSRTFDIGATFRRASTDFDKYGRYIWMENTYCHPQEPDMKKPPICCAAARNPGGDWALAVVNQTGIPNRNGATFFEARTYDVTIDVTELGGVSGIAYDVWRCNNGIRNVLDPQPAVMENGRLSVTVHPCELVSLRPSFNTHFAIEPRDYVYMSPHDTGCGFGVLAALLPPMGLRMHTAARRRRRRARERRKA
ncbi:MAG: hypothetical protein GF418_09170 [Chitinivibrionales bacterium]|nr:hypothetical protein [Chitinivibrionales bacterium]MBD3395778.1 hypothetical protein [Chitinivibrionales bacterium]